MKQFLGLAPISPALMLPVLLLLHATVHTLHTTFLIQAFQEAVPSVSMLAAEYLPAPLDLKAMCWLCVLAGVLLVVVTFYVSLLYSTFYEKEGYDGSTPRTMVTRRSGVGHRLYSSHLNALEDLPSFGLAVACAFFLKVSPRGQLCDNDMMQPDAFELGLDAEYITALCLLHLAWRLLHFFSFAFGVVLPRGLAYAGGVHSTFALFAYAIFGVSFLPLW
eukprot:TRINITY_DN8647_c0_g1_i1.p1 TRINITY_DN8647_c0_g1~~TRINITY_DN8647_c0_g1_i1.p1  ORF type:complete len:219 (+),score=46.75 TRINITY_DN8647_c0_g1_i1:190-846(+)